MKIEELSIGDWVMYRNREWQVCSLYQFTGEVGLWRKDSQICENVADLTPIPLTPEILEKNGWVKITEDMVWAEHLNPKLAEIPTWGLKIGERPVPYLVAKMRDNNHFEITTANLELFRLKVEHVHQLQHALRLAGIEKEIEV